MRCPACPDTTLVMTERQGVEIDYCPTCRGVWLDRGELDKLIERGASQAAPSHPDAGPQHHARSSDSSGRLPGQGRRRSWLSSFFD